MYVIHDGLRHRPTEIVLVVWLLLMALISQTMAKLAVPHGFVLDAILTVFWLTAAIGVLLGKKWGFIAGLAAGGGFTAPQTLVTEVAVIDADLGDILWYNLGQTTENFTQSDNPKPIEKLVNQILSSFPKRK